MLEGVFMAKRKVNNKNRKSIKRNVEITTIKKEKDKSFIPYYFLIAGIGLIIFGLFYGIKVLNPSYTAWMFAASGDLPQHYVGWEAFRVGAWNFPLGLTDVVSYPMDVSVIYTDSIPILAIFFKLISFMLPKTFQYIGFYGLICFILQAVLSAKIIKKYTKSKLNIVLGSVLFMIIPSMIFRMFYHTALASQWLILLALETLFLYDEFNEDNKIYYIWAIIPFLVVTVHFYYIVMCGIILIGYILLDILNTKKIKKSLILLLIYLGVALFTMWLFGGFTNLTYNDIFGFGLFSYNLNGLINPQGWSFILNDLPMIPEQYEGFSYLGLGVILLVLISIVLLVIWFIKDKGILKKHINLMISLFLVSLLSVFVAMSPRAYVGEYLLYDLKLPSFINEFWGIFRSTGRFIWPVIHILMLFGVIIVVKRLNWKVSFIILSLCILVQIIDIGGILVEKNEIYSLNYLINEEYDLYKSDNEWSIIKR